MTDENPLGVMLGGDAAYVRLSRWGSRRPDNGMTAVTIDVKAGPFTGTVREDTLLGIDAFCNDLSRLYEQLIGRATLSSYEKFKMTCEGNGLGAIAISVELYGKHVPLSKLCFEMSVDQTFLPQFIKGLRAEFPDG